MFLIKISYPLGSEMGSDITILTYIVSWALPFEAMLTQAESTRDFQRQQVSLNWEQRFVLKSCLCISHKCMYELALDTANCAPASYLVQMKIACVGD